MELELDDDHAMKNFEPAPFITGYREMTGESVNQLLANPQYATTDAITATPGGGQGNSFQLRHLHNKVDVVASPNDSVLLMEAVPGREVTVTNQGANTLGVWPTRQPPTMAGDQINGAGPNVMATIAPGKFAVLTCYTFGSWWGPVNLG